MPRTPHPKLDGVEGGWSGVSMEQKLAEFRARRQAEHAVKKGEGAGQRQEQTAVAQGETTPTNDSEQTVEETEASRDSPQSSTTKVRHNLLYNYCLHCNEF